MKKIIILISLLSFTSTFATLSQESPKEAIDRLVFGNRAGIHTDAFLIIKNGETLYERYDRGYTATSPHLAWSMSKTLAGIITAIAIEDKKLDITQPLSVGVSAYKGPATLLDAFQMSSGIEFKEEYSGIPVDSDATRMLYLDGPDVGFAHYTATRPNRVGVLPGDHFYYSSGDANLIMESLKTALNDKKVYDNYPWAHFFDLLDLSNVTFEQDSKGTFVGSSYVYMSAQQFARIGALLVNRGLWNGLQIIPEWYFKLMNQVAPGVMKNALPGTSQTRAYSVMTTTNLPITGRNLPSEYPSLPLDSLILIGHQGQLVIASPSEKLIIVRLATDKGDPFGDNRQELFSAIKDFTNHNTVTTFVAAKKPLVQKTSFSAAPIGDYLKLPELIRSLYAKELCSCTFVLGRTLEQCKDDLKQSLPILPFATINNNTKTVTATLTQLVHSTAKYYGPKLGCTLLK